MEFFRRGTLGIKGEEEGSDEVVSGVSHDRRGRIRILARDAKQARPASYLENEEGGVSELPVQRAVQDPRRDYAEGRLQRSANQRFLAYACAERGRQSQDDRRHKTAHGSERTRVVHSQLRAQILFHT